MWSGYGYKFEGNVGLYFLVSQSRSSNRELYFERKNDQAASINEGILTKREFVRRSVNLLIHGESLLTLHN